MVPVCDQQILGWFVISPFSGIQPGRVPGASRRQDARLP
jgi:hypothetical protein